MSFASTRALIVCAVFALIPCGFGAQRDSLRSRTNQAFDAEMAREKAGDCPDAHNTYEFNICYGKAVGATDENLKIYEQAIRDLLSQPSPGGESSARGPAGPNLTSQQLTAEFDHLEQVWHSYMDAACSAAFHQFGGGTGGPSAEMECHLEMVRSHMRELSAIYDGPLHR